MKLFRFSAITCFSIGIISCGQSDSATENNVDWKRYDTKNFWIEYPENWSIDTSEIMNTSIILTSEKSSDQDEFRENVNVLIQDLRGQEIDLDQYTSISEEQIPTMIPAGKIVASERIQKDDREFHKIIYTGKPRNEEIKYEQLYTISDGNAYIISLTCVSAEFDKYKDTGEKILNSFKLK